MSKSPFWVNESYSLGYWLKKYGYYPANWPLYTYMDHGMTLFDTIFPHELETEAPLIFKFSPRLVKEYKRISGKPVYNLMNPTIHCRKMKGIEKSPDANGTLFFPAHSTQLIDDETNWETFITGLENIPEHFRPLDICLHYTDIVKGLGKIFEARGYKVFTAGNLVANEFAENFYSILRNYKCSMSNVMGSYGFYSVEMGIPFSLFGSEPLFQNKGERNLEPGAYVSYKRQPSYIKSQDLFKGFYTEITPAQKEFVEYELGKYHSISRIKTSFLLYKTYVLNRLLTVRRVAIPGASISNG